MAFQKLTNWDDTIASSPSTKELHAKALHDFTLFSCQDQDLENELDAFYFEVKGSKTGNVEKETKNNLPSLFPVRRFTRRQIVRDLMH